MDTPTAFEHARELVAAGKLDEAEEAYRAVGEGDEKYLAALNNLGTLLEEQRRFPEAIALFQQAIALAPEQASLHYNLGHALQVQGRLDSAIGAYRRCLEYDPACQEAWCNLAIALWRQNEISAAGQAFASARQLDPECYVAASGQGATLFESGDIPAALAAYRDAVRLQPGIAQEHFNVAKCLYTMERLPEAVEAYQACLAIDPTSRIAREHLARILVRLDRRNEAAAVYAQWLEIQPGDPVPAHMLAALNDVDTPARPDDAYVRAVFDDFAGDFDQTLERLQYRAPALLAQLLDEVSETPEQRFALLDAGCGTGLSGKALAHRASQLCGVDLSPRMLEKARALDLYDELTEGDLVAFMSSREQAFDAVVAVDTFNYLGDLQPVYAAAARTLRENGLLLFTLEARGSGGPEYALEPNGRYTHDTTYVREALSAAGFRLLILREATLRKESGRPVTGMLVAAIRN